MLFGSVVLCIMIYQTLALSGLAQFCSKNEQAIEENQQR